ncbi:MAG TPA: amino acid permease [Chlamydiales bacterium]|nr:amino acid permease [Chlamydiales bacterium]
MDRSRRFIGVFLLAMLNLSVMTSLRNLPIVAEYGFASAFLYLFVALVFLFPAALISAELATGWNRTGGVYIWVREAFGAGWGFYAIWMQWIHNVTWFPAILSFSATALAYLIQVWLGDEYGFAENKIYLISFILIGFWGFTIFNYFGLKNSSWFSAVGVIAGTILPGILLIVLAIFWLAQGEPPQIQFSFKALIPPLDNIQNLVFLTGLFLAFGGLEVSAAHAREVKDPQKTFPRAVLIAGLVSLILYVAGALSIAIMIPKEHISLISGLMAAFELFLTHFKVGWLLIPVGLMIILGAVGELNAWIIGPVRALHATTKHGDLPPFFQKLNQHGMPANLLFFQALIVTIVSFVFLFMPSASSAFWILSAISAQIYLVMYVLMFLAAIKLRYSHADVPRTYRIPYKMPGIWFVGTLGALSSTFAFLMGFIPPGQLQVGNLIFYECFLIGGIFFMSLIPYLIYRFRDPSWHPELDPDINHPNQDLHS